MDNLLLFDTENGPQLRLIDFGLSGFLRKPKDRRPSSCFQLPQNRWQQCEVAPGHPLMSDGRSLTGLVTQITHLSLRMVQCHGTLQMKTVLTEQSLATSCGTTSTVSSVTWKERRLTSGVWDAWCKSSVSFLTFPKTRPSLHELHQGSSCWASVSIGKKRKGEAGVKDEKAM